MGGNYPHWELSEVYDKMKYQKAVLERNPVFKLMEAAHLVSYYLLLTNLNLLNSCAFRQLSIKFFSIYCNIF